MKAFYKLYTCTNYEYIIPNARLFFIGIPSPSYTGLPSYQPRVSPPPASCSQSFLLYMTMQVVVCTLACVLLHVAKKNLTTTSLNNKDI